MKRFMVFLFVCLMVVMPLMAQYIDEISEFTRQGVGFDMSNARSSAAFLDWSKVQMNPFGLHEYGKFRFWFRILFDLS